MDLKKSSFRSIMAYNKEKVQVLIVVVQAVVYCNLQVDPPV
jgi:hypothetical protein